MAALAKLSDPIAQWFGSHRQPLVAIISDVFLGWTQHLADELNVPRFTFFPTRVLMVAVFDHCFRDPDAVRGKDVVEFVDLPKTVSLRYEHLPSLFRRYRASDPDWEAVRDGMIANISSFGCIFDDFNSLEDEYLTWLMSESGHERVYAVGPLNLLGPDRTEWGNPDSDSLNHVFSWLDGCPDGSVVYVCFGSQKLVTNAQMEALASGLEKSAVRFEWVVKTSVRSGFGVVPDGFEERVRNTSLVIRGWAPQVKLLAHQAVGGFLSHCGLNSVLEGVVRGAMILGWPMEADQFVNASLLVEELGVGVRVCQGADSVPDSDELGRLIGESMVDGGNERMKKAQDLKAKALDVVKDGGTSLRDLDRMMRDLNKLQVA